MPVYIIRGRARDQLWLENHLRALRESLWVALLAAQDVELDVLEQQIVPLLADVDTLLERTRREALT